MINIIQRVSNSGRFKFHFHVFCMALTIMCSVWNQVRAETEMRALPIGVAQMDCAGKIGGVVYKMKTARDLFLPNGYRIYSSDANDLNHVILPDLVEMGPLRTFRITGLANGCSLLISGSAIMVHDYPFRRDMVVDAMPFAYSPIVGEAVAALTKQLQRQCLAEGRTTEAGDCSAFIQEQMTARAVFFETVVSTGENSETEASQEILLFDGVYIAGNFGKNSMMDKASFLQEIR